MKYTVEYCKNNKVAIQVNSEEEYNQLLKYFDKQSDYFENQLCVRFFNDELGHAPESYYRSCTDFQIITFQQFKQSQMKKLIEFTGKDVIHCPTLELKNKIKNLLKEQNLPHSNCLDFQWEQYKKGFCFNPIRDEYSGMAFYEANGFTIHKAEDILALYEEKLPGEYIVKVNSAKEASIVCSYIKEREFAVFCEEFKYVITSKEHDKTDNLHHVLPQDSNHLPILTFKEFQDKIMNKTAKKILGYLSPMDLFGESIKKGTLYKKITYKNTNQYEPEGDSLSSLYNLPKEIVETWEKVFEDEFKVGDWIYAEYAGSECDLRYKKDIPLFKLQEISNQTSIYLRPKKGYSSGVMKQYCRKATQAEIDSLFNKTLTLSNGKQVCIKSGEITGQNEKVRLEDLKSLMKYNTKIKLNDWSINFNIESIDIGCWKKVKISDIQLIIKTAEEQIELMKD